MKTHSLPILALLLGAFFTPVCASAQAPAGVKATRDLAYVEGGSAAQKLDLFVPEKPGGLWPLVIWIHGGGWSAGDKGVCPAQRLTQQSYAVASINYRLSQEAIFPAQIEDCKAAIRWLRAQAGEYHLDPNRFGVWGNSAGGHLVALVGTSGSTKEFDKGAHLDVSSRVQAVCDYYGPTDLLQIQAHMLPGGRMQHDAADSPEARLIGGAIQENKEKAARVNPIGYITPDAPPFLIVHGDQDPLVPMQQSQLLFEALKKAGVSAHFHMIHGAGHGSGFAGKNIDDMVDAFFEKHLKEPPSAGSAPETLATESTAPAGGPGGAPAAANGGARRGIPWEAVLARDDKNKDGKIGREEFSGPPQLFDRIDTNHDGFITREEHEAFMAQRLAQPPAAPAAATPKPATAPQ